jgi:hypothetical protein
MATTRSEVLCYDWSHVRDASEAAHLRAARLLRRGFRQLPEADRGKIYDLLFEHYGEPQAAA